MAKSRSKTAENAAQVYKTSRRWETNRLRKLERALKRNPENKQIETAMKNMVYRRRTPTTRPWSHSMRRQAEQFKRFVGRVATDMFSSNEKLSAPALLKPGTAQKQKPFDQSQMFALGTRAHNGAGTSVWN
jgi:hypothetical protein